MTSLGRQLLWASFSVGVPPLAIIAVLSLVVASEQIETGLRERLLTGARGTELAMGVAMDRTRARAAAVARDPDLQQAILDGHQRKVLGLAERALEMIDVERTTVVDAHRRVLARGHRPAHDGDIWTETGVGLSGQAWSAVGGGSAGLSIHVVVPILDSHGRVLGSLIAQKAIDYASLLELRSQFGLDFAVWDGDRLQATTLSSAEDIAEAERARRQISSTEPVHRGTTHDFAAAHFRANELGKGTLLIAVDIQAATTLERRLTALYLMVALGMICLTTAGAFLSARRIVRPLRRLASAAEAAARGDLEGSLQLEGPREIQELAGSFSNMLGKRREAEDELRRTQAELEQRVVARTEALRQSEEHLQKARQLEALGRLAGGVAHDFNNVLTAIGGNAELVAADLEALNAPDEVKDGIAEIRQSAAHAAEIIRQLMAFSRQQVAAPVVLDLGRTVLALERMLRRLCTEDIRLSLSVDPGLRPILADPTQVGQIVVNLVVNAQDALPDGGNVRVRVYELERTPEPDQAATAPGQGRHVCLEVTDDGLGMDAETARRIFEPFFTTKAPGKGTGMGLATVHGIAKQCGAHIEVDTQPDQGTTFRVLFPAAAQSLAPPASASEPAVPRGRELILLCEDEVSVRALTATFLSSGGYDVLAASSGRDALALAKSRPDTALLVTDVVMPEMNGVELARQLRERLPSLKVLYMSGYTASIIDSRTDSGARDAVLAKPFTKAELLRQVRRALDAPSSASDSSIKTRS